MTPVSPNIDWLFPLSSPRSGTWCGAPSLRWTSCWRMTPVSPLSSPQIWDLVRSPEFEMNQLLNNDDLFLLPLIDYLLFPPSRSGSWCGARSLRWSGCWRMTTCFFYHWFVASPLLPQIWVLMRSPEFAMIRLLKNDNLFLLSLICCFPSPPPDLGPDAEPGVLDELAAEEWRPVSPIIDWLLPLSSPQIWDLVRSPEFETNRLLKNDDLFLLSLIDYSPSPPPDLGPGPEPGVWDEPAAEEW